MLLLMVVVVVVAMLLMVMMQQHGMPGLSTTGHWDTGEKWGCLALTAAAVRP